MPAKPDEREKVEDSVLACVEPSRVEEGAIAYDVHVDSEDRLLFVVVEHWASAEVRDRHLQTLHFKRLGREVDDPDRLSHHKFQVLHPL